MTVKEFVDGYVKGGKREEYVKKHIVDVYVPFAEKMRLCDSIAQATTHIHDEATGNERFSVNTAARYVLFMATIIDKYTDADVDFNHVTEEFDILDKYGLCDVIVQCIDQHEYSTFDTLLKMAVGDIVQNERDLVGWLDRAKDVMRLVVAETLKAVEEQETTGQVDRELAV